MLRRSGCGCRAPGGAVPGLRSTGVRAVARGLCCSSACGIIYDQGSNPSPLHWREGSLPLSHQGSPNIYSSLKAQFIRSCLWSHIYALLPTSQGTEMIIGDKSGPISLPGKIEIWREDVYQSDGIKLVTGMHCFSSEENSQNA